MDIYYRKISSILTFNCCSIFQHFLFDETVKKIGGSNIFKNLRKSKFKRDKQTDKSSIYVKEEDYKGRFIETLYICNLSISY